MCRSVNPTISRPFFTSVRTSGSRLSSVVTVTDVLGPTAIVALTPCSTLTAEHSPRLRLSSLGLPLPFTANAITASFARTIHCIGTLRESDPVPTAASERDCEGKCFGSAAAPDDQWHQQCNERERRAGDACPSRSQSRV